MNYNYINRIEQKFPCGCHVDEMIDESYGITYCPKHAAAPDMYKALLDFTYAYRRDIDSELSAAYKKSQKALAKAEGEEPS